MDGFYTHFDTYEFILDNLPDVGHFAIVSTSLTLFSEGPGTLRDYQRVPDPVRMRYSGLMLLPEGPRTLRNCLEGPGIL